MIIQDLTRTTSEVDKFVTEELREICGVRKTPVILFQLTLEMKMCGIIQKKTFQYFKEHH